MSDNMIRPKAVEVTPQSDYCLLVTFSDDEKRIFDVKPYRVAANCLVGAAAG